MKARNRKWNIAERTVFWYMLVAMAWIIFSDNLAALIARDDAQLVFISSLKGVMFVVVTGGLLYVLLRRQLMELVTLNRNLNSTRIRLQAVLDSAPIAIMALDPQGNVIVWNNGAERIFGWKSEEAVGKFLPYLRKDETSQFEIIRDQIIQGKSLHNVEIRRHNRDGQEVELSISVAPYRDEDGKIAGILAIGEDITQTRNLKIENEKLSRQFYQAQKMESIGQLAGGIAHDFNNLLVPIMGYAQMTRSKIKEDRHLDAYLAQIEKAAERASNLTRQILAYSRQQVLEMKSVDLNTLIGEYQNMLTRIIGETIKLDFIQHGNLKSVLADAGQIEQVLLNLVVNARDAMPDGGKLIIETDMVTLDEAYCNDHDGVKPGDYCLLAVSDTGMGMGKDEIGKIFDPFYTTKEKGQGTGLGLATVFGIVRQHNGHIWVYSEAGQGSTFKIYLPVSQNELDTDTEETEYTGTMEGHETILVAEDDVAVREVVLNNLMEYGYNVLEASSGKDALSIVTELDGKIDILLTDVILPKMNGKELYSKISEKYPAIPVLFMSGYTNNVIAHHGVLDAGVNFIQKPFRSEDLLRRLRQVLQSSN